VGYFCPPGSGSTDPIESGSTTLASDRSASPSSSSGCSILHLPEEVICLIVGRLDVSSLAALEAACSHLRKMIVNARLWRRIFMAKMEMEPGLQVCVCRLQSSVGDLWHFGADPDSRILTSDSGSDSFLQ
jgi:hypothetical protein